jgi:hypothetical protein
MTKVANSYYSAAVAHKEIDGLYQATFGIPGEPPQWVNEANGRPQVFRSANEAMLAGFRCMVAKLNRARQEQDFHVNGSNTRKNTIKSWSATPRANEPTVDSVFGKKQ